MAARLERLDWDRDGREWPNRETSRFVEADGLRWHVQEMGSGDVLLLLHGSGASTHSWRDLAPLLAHHFRVVALDLPGHGFTSPLQPDQLSLPGVARAVHAVLNSLQLDPAIVVGHSAGAALAAYMAVHELIAPRLLVSLNGAHLPIRGLPSWLFSPFSGLFAEGQLIPRIFARRAEERRTVERLLGETGSQLDQRGFALYWMLARNPAHVAGTLSLMAAWDVRPLARQLQHLQVPLVLVTGDNDTTVPPADSRRVSELAPHSTWISMPGLGHLAHEEAPEQTAALIVEAAGKTDQPDEAER